MPAPCSAGGAIRRLAYALGCWVAIATANAAERAPGERDVRVWINPGVLSYHFDRGLGLREDNWGLGAEILFGERHGAMAGTLINSNRARTRYAAYQWRPLQRRLSGMRASAGIALGAFDGYPSYRSGAWFPAAVPMLALEGERFGLNVYVIPGVAGRVHSALAVQLKLRVW